MGFPKAGCKTKDLDANIFYLGDDVRKHSRGVGNETGKGEKPIKDVLEQAGSNRGSILLCNLWKTM